jgi:hypothetical protein
MTKPGRKKGQRSKLSDEQTQVAFRMDNAMLARVDAFAERMTQEGGGLRYTRTDAVRRLLWEALKAADEQHDGPRPRAGTRGRRG